MIQEWQSSPDYKVEKDQGWTECARFLASVDSVQAIAALGKNLPARPLQTRMAILHNLGEGGTLSGEIRPIAERPISADGIEALLITLLDDAGQQPGDSGPRMGRHYRDVRICDMASYYLNQLWPARYHFNFSDSWASRWQHRIESANTWRQAHQQAALPSPFTDEPPFDGDRKKIAAVYWLPGSLKPTSALANCFSNLQNESLSAATLRMALTMPPI